MRSHAEEDIYDDSSPIPVRFFSVFPLSQANEQANKSVRTLRTQHRENFSSSIAIIDRSSGPTDTIFYVFCGKDSIAMGSRLIKGIGSGVGLAAEAIANHKEKKARSALSASSYSAEHQSSRDLRQDSPPTYDELYDVPRGRADDFEENAKAVAVDTKASLSKERSGGESDDSLDDDDEAAWRLDEATERADSPHLAPPKAKNGLDGQPTVEAFVAQVMARCGPPPAEAWIHPLPAPVIIPQRRPGTKERGFVRAYSPVLEDHGIGQDTFLSFIKNEHLASKASPILNVVFISAGIAGFAPSITAAIVTTIVQVAAGTAIEIQKRRRTNTFLDQINEQMFKPRGLYAMIMAYDPHAERPVDVRQMNSDEIVSKRDNHEGSQWKNHLKATSGTTYGETELPESAPLVFPALDEVAEVQDKQQTGKWKSSQKFVQDYYDKRAHLSYAQRNPGDKMAQSTAQPHFKSGLSDPSHPAYQGGLLTLVSGGIIPGRRSPAREWREKRRTDDLRVRNPYTPGGAIRTLRNKSRQMKRGMLYLMVVNMPTDEELAQARQRLGEMEQQAKTQRFGGR